MEPGNKNGLQRQAEKKKPKSDGISKFGRKKENLGLVGKSKLETEKQPLQKSGAYSLQAPSARRTAQIAWLIRQEYPAVDLAFWDLSEFLPVFHNVRRQMVFIECDQQAHESVLRLLANAPETKDCITYAGDLKPKTVNESWAMAKSTEEIIEQVFDFLAQNAQVIFLIIAVILGWLLAKGEN